jgi:hypothetical protein
MFSGNVPPETLVYPRRAAIMLSSPPAISVGNFGLVRMAAKELTRTALRPPYRRDPRVKSPDSLRRLVLYEDCCIEKAISSMRGATIAGLM